MKQKTIELICPTDSMSQHQSHAWIQDGAKWRCSRPYCKATTRFPTAIEIAEEHNWQLSYVPGHGRYTYNIKEPHRPQVVEILC